MTERVKQYKGSISYQKLWDVMKEKHMNRNMLRNDYNISPTIINRLNKNENVAVDTIMYLCDILKCKPGDIMDYIPADDSDTSTDDANIPTDE